MNITEVERTYDEISQSTFVVANREASIASSLADMADRQRIEQTYAQGATQLYAQALQLIPLSPVSVTIPPPPSDVSMLPPP